MWWWVILGNMKLKFEWKFMLADRWESFTRDDNWSEENWIYFQGKKVERQNRGPGTEHGRTHLLLKAVLERKNSQEREWNNQINKQRNKMVLLRKSRQGSRRYFKTAQWYKTWDPQALCFVYLSVCFIINGKGSINVCWIYK